MHVILNQYWNVCLFDQFRAVRSIVISENLPYVLLASNS